MPPKVTRRKQKSNGMRNEMRNERRRKKRQEDKLKSTKPPRPPNRFILYRTHKQLEYAKNPNLLYQRLKNRDPNNPVGMRELSTVISEDWASEPSHVKEEWDRIAEQIKLMAPYNKNFDSINELRFELNSTEFGTFVNATSANSRQTFQQLKNVSENFIFEPPCHAPLEQKPPIQPFEDDTDIPTPLFNGLSIDESSFEFIDPRLIGFSNVDDPNFFIGEPMFPQIFTLESGDNPLLEFGDSFFGSESPLSTQTESSFSTPTEDTDIYHWEF